MPLNVLQVNFIRLTTSTGANVDAFVLKVLSPPTIRYPQSNPVIHNLIQYSRILDNFYESKVRVSFIQWRVSPFPACNEMFATCSSLEDSPLFLRFNFRVFFLHLSTVTNTDLGVVVNKLVCHWLYGY